MVLVMFLGPVTLHATIFILFLKHNHYFFFNISKQHGSRISNEVKLSGWSWPRRYCILFYSKHGSMNCQLYMRIAKIG